MRNDSRATPLKLGKNEIAIFEGIHALNDDIAGRHPEATKLYISARSNINEGAVLRFKGTWMRLTRRAVRDYHFRGTDVEDTLEMWANVRRGEKLYISPYKNRADIIFDSSLPYEVSVMKNYAVPLLHGGARGQRAPRRAAGAHRRLPVLRAHRPRAGGQGLPAAGVHRRRQLSLLLIHLLGRPAAAQQRTEKLR